MLEISISNKFVNISIKFVNISITFVNISIIFVNIINKFEPVSKLLIHVSNKDFKTCLLELHCVSSVKNIKSRLQC